VERRFEAGGSSGQQDVAWVLVMFAGVFAAVVAAVHLVTNVAGNAIGARRTAI
jgi:hypothetical protein